MTPKFQVGEEVILQSKSHPEFNGEYRVVLVVHGVCEVGDPHYPVRYKWSSPPPTGYVLDDPSLFEVDSRHTGSIFWGESALRKKHTPGEMPFDDLMATIKSGQPVKGGV